MKNHYVVAVGFALAILVCTFGGCQGVFAQYTQDGKSCPLASDVSITSPSNMTYRSVSLPLAISMRGYLNPATYHVEAVYSIDKNQNATIPTTVTFVPVTSTSTNADGTTTTGISSLFSYYQIIGNTTLPPLPDGTHMLTVYVTCSHISSNDGSWPAVIYANSTVSFTVNSGVPPTLTILSITNTTYSHNNLNLCVATDKATGWVGYSLDGQTNQTFNGNTTLPTLTNGPHTLTVYANDTVGNMGTSGKIAFSVDVPSDSVGLYTVAFGLPIAVAVGAAGLLIMFYRKNKK